MLVATLLAVALSQRAFAFDCPARCNCGEGRGEREYICRQESAVYQVNGLPNSYATIHCENPALDWSELPLFPFSSNGTLESLTLSNCRLPGTFASALASFGANEVQSIVLKEAPGELSAEHVKGLRAVEKITMIDAADQTRIPYDVFDALPALRDFRIRGAQLHLEENGGKSSPLPATPHPALRAVELASSSIADVPPGAFLKLSYLNRLYLWGNKIQNFTNDSFRGLDQLEVLDLTGNPLTSLPARAFAATRLRSLTLVATRLGDVPGDAFEGLSSLEEVLFKFGRGSIKLGPRALAALPALKKLTFDRTAVLPIPGDLLEGSTALEELTFKGTGLEVLPGGLFHTQQAVKQLDLSDNKIKALDADVFWKMKALKELNLDGNDIEEFPEQLFSGLTNLKSVSANNNRLKYIAADAFQGATFLEYLSLNNNQLTLKPRTSPVAGYLSDDQSPFRTLFDLKELHLQGNEISEVFSDWKWSLVTNLKMLDLSRNNFTYLSRADVQFLGAGLVIDLRHNHITTVNVLEATPGLMTDDERVNTDTGGVLLLDDNPFSCDCELYLFVRRLHGSKPLASEPKLDVGDAKCASPPAFAGKLVKDVTPGSLTCSLLPRDCPANCTCDVRPATLALEMDCEAEPATYPDPKSQGLLYTRLRLRSIQSLKLPPDVVSLNLSGVGLTESPSLQSLHKVTELDLSYNHLIDAPVELLKENLTLRLAGNPFACDCSHFNNVYALQYYITRIADADNVTCSGGESTWNIDAARLCDIRRAALLGGTLAAIGIFAGVLAALTYHYLLEIKVFLYSRGWCQSLIKEDELDKDAQYDAFVSFSEKDAKWVSQELIPKLEGSPNNFKLCVHYRDWNLGDMIPAQIARSVALSRRTIVVLSKNFLKSTWAPLEFRTANTRAQRERRARVLVIVLEDVPDSKQMDDELKAYLSTNTYLKWGDPWFWEKLKFAMPHKKKGHLNEVFVVDKLKSGGLDARLTADGKIFNNATPQRF